MLPRWYRAGRRWPNWLLCELAIGACDLAEVLGSGSPSICSPTTISRCSGRHSYRPRRPAFVSVGNVRMRSIEAIVLLLV